MLSLEMCNSGDEITFVVSIASLYDVGDVTLKYFIIMVSRRFLSPAGQRGNQVRAAKLVICQDLFLACWQQL